MIFVNIMIDSIKNIQKIGFLSKFRAIKLKISPRGYFCTPDRSRMVPGPPEPLNDEKNRFFEKIEKFDFLYADMMMMGVGGSSGSF